MDIGFIERYLRDRSLFMTRAAGSNDFLWKIFLHPTRRGKKKICGLLNVAENFSMPTLVGKNKQVFYRLNV